VLNLEVDPTQIDVNVHPRKLEIRFANENQVFRAFYHAIEEKLKQTSLISENIQTNNFDLNFQNTSQNKTNISQNQKFYTPSGTKFKNYSPYKDVTINPAQTKIEDSIHFSKEILGTTNSNTFEKSNDLHDTPLGKIIGQMHNSYILVETKDGLEILDQHALAERIIYEKLVKNS
jgi:DNA mismatch repair protein MutL